MSSSPFIALKGRPFFCAGVIVILAALNVLQIASTYGWRQRVERLEQDRVFSQDELIRRRIERSIIGKALRDTFIGKANLQLSALVHQTRISILFFFSARDCASCIQDEVHLLRELRVGNRIQVISFWVATSAEASIATAHLSMGLDPDFQVYDLPDQRLVVNELIHPLTPLVLVVDANMKVLAVHVPEAGDYYKSLSFYELFRRLLF